MCPLGQQEFQRNRKQHSRAASSPLPADIGMFLVQTHTPCAFVGATCADSLRKSLLSNCIGWKRSHLTTRFSRRRARLTASVRQHMSTHIFIDNSNVFHGARRAADTLEPAALWLAVRVYYRNLFQLVEKGHGSIATRVMAGSVPRGNDDLWDYSRAQGYDTDLLRKVTKDDGTIGEQAVDEILHLKIANALLDHAGQNTLVLVTGDGRISKYNTSFPQQVTRALQRGWGVEVWSWKAQLSAEFTRLQAKAGNFLSIHDLDRWYKQVTFVQPGMYDVKGTKVKIAGRVVSKFP